MKPNIFPGYYWEGSQKPSTLALSHEERVKRMTDDLTKGWDGGEARCGVTGEVGCSWPLTGISFVLYDMLDWKSYHSSIYYSKLIQIIVSSTSLPSYLFMIHVRLGARCPKIYSSRICSRRYATRHEFTDRVQQTCNFWYRIAYWDPGGPETSH